VIAVKVRIQKPVISANLRTCWIALADAIGIKTGKDAPRRLQFPVATTKFPPQALVEQRFSVLKHAWEWFQGRVKTEQKTRKLRVCESVQLGEKKFVALIQADGQRFLIGGTSGSITLLATLASSDDFRSLLPQDALLEVSK
jgi:hypothetical protein